MRKIKNYSDLEDFVDFLYLYFDTNKETFEKGKITWIKLCDCLKGGENYIKERN